MKAVEFHKFLEQKWRQPHSIYVIYNPWGLTLIESLITVYSATVDLNPVKDSFTDTLTNIPWNLKSFNIGPIGISKFRYDQIYCPVLLKETAKMHLNKLNGCKP